MQVFFISFFFNHIHRGKPKRSIAFKLYALFPGLSTYVFNSPTRFKTNQYPPITQGFPFRAMSRYLGTSFSRVSGLIKGSDKAVTPK